MKTLLLAGLAGSLALLAACVEEEGPAPAAPQAPISAAPSPVEAAPPPADAAPPAVSPEPDAPTVATPSPTPDAPADAAAPGPAPEPSPDPSPDAAAVQTPALRVAMVDLALLMENTPIARREAQTLMDSRDRYMRELFDMQDRLRASQEQLVLAAPILTPEEMTARKRQLEADLAALQQKTKASDQQLEIEGMAARNRTQIATLKLVDAYRIANGHDAIMLKDAVGGIDGVLDITAQVRATIE